MKTLGSITLLALVASFATGCGALKNAGIDKGTANGIAATTIQFSIPLTSKHSATPAVSKARTMDSVKPEFIDSGALTSGGAALQVYVDGTNVAAITGFAPLPAGENGPIAGPGSTTPAPTPNGGNITWTSTITATEIDVTMNLTADTGVQHTFGVVETNGACVGTDPCLGDGSGTAQSYGSGVNLGYVLAEGQTTFTLSSTGTNPDVNLTLKGVIEGGFICWNDNCDNSTPLTAGIPVVAYPVTENDDPVTNSTYSNGWWDIEEIDGKNLVQINATNLQPYNKPNLDASGWDAEPFTLTCLGTGDATIAMKLLPNNSSSSGPVTGFGYKAQNYPAAGALLGHTGSDLYFGNGDGVTIHCETYGAVKIGVN